MKKKHTILLISLLLLYSVYKGVREMFWVKHHSYTIDHTLNIQVRMDTDVFGFQDYNYDKTITIKNNGANTSVQLAYVSLVPDVYFYLDTVNNKKVLSVVDAFAGKNDYDYTTLKLINKDCFETFGGCGGFNDSALALLGKPYLTYHPYGFHK